MTRIRLPNRPKRPTDPMKPQPKPKERVGGRQMSGIDSSKRGIEGKIKGYSKGGPVLTKTRGTGAATKGLNFYRQTD